MSAAAVLPARHIDASLNYFTGKESFYSVDFSQPGAEERHGEIEQLNENVLVKINDARGLESQFSLATNGFVYAKQKVEGLEDCKTDEEVMALVVPETEKLVRELLGAKKTFVFTTRIRNVSEDSNKRAESRAPALSVHADFTPGGSESGFKLAVPDEEERKKMMSERVMLINVWRPLKTITRDPLCVCDWNSVKVEEDSVKLRFDSPNGSNELAKWRKREGHKWYYMNEQTPEEPLVFVQYDSDAPDGKNVPHSAFIDPGRVDGPPRESIEIKMAVAFFN